LRPIVVVWPSVVAPMKPVTIGRICLERLKRREKYARVRRLVAGNCTLAWVN